MTSGSSFPWFQYRSSILGRFAAQSSWLSDGAGMVVKDKKVALDRPMRATQQAQGKETKA